MNSQLLNLPAAMAFGASVCFVQQIEAGTPTENYFPLFGVDNSNAKIAESLTLSPIDFAALEEANVVDSSAEISEQTKLKNFFNERAARWEKESKIHSSPGSKLAFRSSRRRTRYTNSRLKVTSRSASETRRRSRH